MMTHQRQPKNDGARTPGFAGRVALTPGDVLRIVGVQAVNEPDHSNVLLTPPLSTMILPKGQTLAVLILGTATDRAIPPGQLQMDAQALLGNLGYVPGPLLGIALGRVQALEEVLQSAGITLPASEHWPFTHENEGWAFHPEKLIPEEPHA